MQYNDHQCIAVEGHTAQAARTLPLLQDAHNDGHRGGANGSHAIALQQHKSFSTRTETETQQQRDRMKAKKDAKALLSMGTGDREEYMRKRLPLTKLSQFRSCCPSPMEEHEAFVV